MNITLNKTVFEVVLSDESEHTFTVTPGNDSRVVIDANALYGAGGAMPTAWGGITGSLNAQLDLKAALDSKAASDHTHTEIFPTTTDWANFENILFT